MSGAGAALQAAAMTALQAAGGIGGVYAGTPVQAVFPYATVDCGLESDWSHKSGSGREIRLAVTLRHAREKRVALQALVAEAEAAVSTLAFEDSSWTLVTLQFVRSRIVEETRSTSVAGVIEYRARLLAR